MQTIHDITCGYYLAQNKARVTSALTIGLSDSYTDAAANGPITNVGADDGDRAPFFPKTILTLNADYGIACCLGDGEWRSERIGIGRDRKAAGDYSVETRRLHMRG